MGCAFRIGAATNKQTDRTKKEKKKKKREKIEKEFYMRFTHSLAHSFAGNVHPKHTHLFAHSLK